jgi:hypothetical protein
MADSHKATTINHFHEKLIKIKVCVESLGKSTCLLVWLQ